MVVIHEAVSDIEDVQYLTIFFTSSNITIIYDCNAFCLLPV